MKTSAKELRTHAKRLLETVERGEEVTITRRGQPCAKLIPIAKQRRTGKKAAELPLFGIWKDHAATRNVAAHVNKLRRGRY